jgi:hypothetical protein
MHSEFAHTFVHGHISLHTLYTVSILDIRPKVKNTAFLKCRGEGLINLADGCGDVQSEKGAFKK